MDARFDRQVRFAPFGPEGQRRLGAARVLVVGVGALGSSVAQNLARSGAGTLVLVDRDVVDASNLARQVLFEDRHAREGALKVDAAREALARIGGPTLVEAHAAHLDADNVEELARGATLVVDGTDNLATRWLLNDFAVARGVPWVYGGVVGARGLVLAVRPGAGPCLRCVFPDPPPPGSLPTCDTAGVLEPAVAAVAALQSGAALRLAADPERFAPALLEIDVWDGALRERRLARDPGCPCCGRRHFPFLESPPAQRERSARGRGTVQVHPGRARPDLAALERSLAPLARSVERRGAVLRFEVEERRFTVFADGRALIEGVDDEGRALALYDRYVGR